MCFAALKYPTTGLEAWQIALICVGSILLAAAIGVIIFLVIRAKREKEKAILDANNQAYEMSGAALGIPMMMNPITIKIGRNEIVPE